MKFKNSTDNTNFEISVRERVYTLPAGSEIFIDSFEKAFICSEDKSSLEVQKLSDKKLFNYILAAGTMSLKCYLQLKAKIMANDIEGSFVQIECKEIAADELAIYKAPIILSADGKTINTEYSTKDFSSVKNKYFLFCAFYDYNCIFYLTLTAFLTGLICIVCGYSNEKVIRGLLLCFIPCVYFGISLTRRRRKLTKYKSGKKIKKVIDATNEL